MTPATMSPSRPRNSPSTASSRDVAQTLVDDLLGRERRDAAEVARAVLGLADDVALVVELGHEDGHVTGLAVEVDARAGGWSMWPCGDRLVGVLQVGGQDRLLDDLHQLVEGDLSLALHETQDAEVDVHAGLLYSDLAAANRATDSAIYGTRSWARRP